ncbi:TIGR03086 family protein [Friedmanniella luteola]|uniref:TIGR03086 family protein n=1 Tax=Friedmanniella luteola TaxID=546871 RepID=A0A1H1Y9T5_9ACTN|nr:TIGR03086 family metal-binding protein [Friedmanniella luteola]SDT18298.1 TIGR03086 family protein [Friedmanniella luteola]
MTSPQTTLLDLRAPAAEIARLAADLTDDQLGGETPCQIRVHQLLAHVLGLSVAFADAAAKVDGPTTRTAPSPAALRLPDAWREQLPARLDALVTAWHQPEAWSGTAVAGGVEMPGAVLGLVANDELVLHGWDLAVATGQSFHVAPANLEAAWQLVSGTPDDPAARDGLFGPVVPVPADAPLLDRLLGGAGRDPHWPAG